MLCRRLLARLALASLVCAGLLAIPAAVQAATLPSQQFPATQLAPSLSYPPQLISQPDGGVTVGGCGTFNGNSLGFVQYSATGTQVQASALIVNGRTLYVCANQSAVGSDGTVYTDAYDPKANKEVLLAFKGSSQKWIYTPPCESISALTLGANGNVYLLTTGRPCSSPRLVGVKSTSPTVVANTEIARQVVPSGGLSPYSGGLVVKFYDGIGFYSYTGQQNTSAAGWNIPSLGFVGDGGQSFVTESGVAMMPILGSSDLPAQCLGDSNIASSINAYTPGSLLWSHSLPTCSRVLAIRPMYNGGAIALLEVKDLLSLDYQRKLYAISPNDTSSPLWSAPLLKTVGDMAFGNMAFSGDMNGNIVVQQQFTRRESGYDYPAVLVSLVSGFTGANISALEIAGGATQGYGYCIPGGGTAIPTVAKDVVYLPLAHGNGTGGCDYSTTSLHAFKLPGATLDYPRGAIYTSTAPWKNYVALGDSYSSAEGLSPYLPPSDTDGCHRSYLAYGKLLDGNPTVRLRLTGFTACSGATSSEIAGGKNGEPSQLNKLDKGTKVVTVTVGGNDIGFSDFATSCTLGDCNGEAHDRAISKIVNELPANLDTLFTKIKAKIDTRTAKVLVAGYPMLIPNDSVVSNSPVACAYLLTDAAAARDVITRLNQAIAAAVKRAGSALRYVDPNTATSPFAGHELCTADSYFNGPQWPITPEVSYHPNNKGQDAYGRLIVSYMANNGI